MSSLESVSESTHWLSGEPLVKMSTMSGEHGRYRVRLARRGDLHGLPQIERRAARRFFDGGYGSLLGSVRPSLETLERRQFLGRVWVAAQQHEGVVAFATASLIDGNAHLDDLHVDPAHGSMGLGTRLIEAVCTWAWRAAATAVTLSTLREVPWNEPFYSKRGFRTLGESELGRGLRELRELEARAGLPVAERVMMVRELL